MIRLRSGSASDALSGDGPPDALARSQVGASRGPVFNALTPFCPSGATGGIRSVSGKMISWSNPSVLALCGAADPVECMERLVRNLVLKAMDGGWAGPPFNPLRLADMLGIPVEASAHVEEARTVPGKYGPCIEFNPNRPRARTRFSVAHEIAHTLFPDVGDRPRNRGGDGTSDDWQLEALCNLAAAEIVMPIGSLGARQDIEPIEGLMAERAKFDVSAEAFLIRVVKVAAKPAMMCCFSPREEAASMRLDYSTRSASWDLDVDRGYLGKLASMCTAAGQTLHGTASSGDGRPLSVECIGIPGRRDAILPRVAVLVRESSARPSTRGIAYRHGDVLRPPGNGERIVCQMVNDKAMRWGGGVAAAAARDCPEAQSAFSSWLASVPGNERLGLVHFHAAGGSRTLASLVAQEGFGSSPSPRIRYSALARALGAVAERALRTDASVHMPRIGTGAAGGTWEMVEQLVVEEVMSLGVQVTVYDPPPRPRREQADLFS